MQRLIDDGHAYAAEGDVYFDVRAFPGYGSLSGQRIDEMLPAADSDASAKRDPRDFALWKAAKPGEPRVGHPVGPGPAGLAPGVLGDGGASTSAPSFDIHGGGLDLVFPHHENEIAQSKAAGDGFANYWLHNAWVTMGGEKMSKSLGNSLLVDEVVQRVRPVELRYYLAGSHYRSMLEYSDESVAEAGQGYRRIEGFLTRAAEALGVAGAPEVRPDARPDVVRRGHGRRHRGAAGAGRRARAGACGQRRARCRRHRRCRPPRSTRWWPWSTCWA